MKKIEGFEKMRAAGMITALAALLFLLPAQGAQVSLDVAMDKSCVAPNVRQTAYLRVALKGFEWEKDADRPPVNVAIVLDKSGSMQGEKLEKAKEAAIMVMDRLRSNDIVSVVAYDSQVTVLVPATKVSDRGNIQSAIRNLSAGSNTALFAGVSKGAEEVRKFLEKQRVNRVILLSDGLANEGPSSPGDLAELGSSLIRESISVTTIGLGLDYNEDLMAALARKSDGNHMFAEKAQDLASAFEREFGDLVSVVAKHVNISITCQPGVRPVRALGREVAISGQNIHADLNQICGNQEKYILLEVELEPTAAGSTNLVAIVDVSYMNLATNTEDHLQKNPSVEITDSAERIAASTNREVMEAVAYQVSVERNELAMRLRDEGKIDEAKQTLRENLQYLEKNKLNTAPWYGDNSKQLEQMESDESEWEGFRKGMIEHQQTLKQQSAI